MDLSLLLPFLTASIVLTISPGPDILYVITSSSAKGFKTGFAIALGLCSGLIIHASIVAFGAAQFILSTPWLIFSIKLFGCGYLIWLAYSTYRSSHKVSLVENTVSEQKFRRLFQKGFWMNVLNPKVTLFFLAFLPQFIPTESANPLVEAYILSSIFFLQGLLIFTLVAYFSNAILGFMRKSENGLLALKWAQIAIFSTLALAILFS